MNPEVERLFSEAADLNETNRRAYLDAHCTDPAVRAEVEALLAFDGRPDSVLADPLLRVAERVATEAPLPDTRMIGPWRVVRPLGRGGMGTVYEVARLDGEVVQRAAIKFVPLALRTEVVLDRFRQERQILADLNHPAICRLIDAGTSPDGAPYLVMELIEGQPIDQWCEERKLGPRQIVSLFLEVCPAVEHAHRNLVIHRDLKPQNILVTAAGEPKLLDFGIAKLLDRAADEGTTTLHALTPDYASPEQIEGRAMNTATDIYSLGCVLYRLLTGEPPRRDLNAARSMTLPRASVRRPELRGDLDNILNKCLQPEPERRYASVEQLSDDLRRYLNHLPVSATADSWSYRVLRFLRRHRLAAAATLALAASIAGGVTSSLWQARRAERRFQQLRRLANEFLFQFEERIRDVSGTTEARQFVVTTAIDYLTNLAAESGGDAGLETELATAYRKVSEVQFDATAPSLGDLAGARASLEKAAELLEGAGAADEEEWIRVALRRSEVAEAGGDLRGALHWAEQGRRAADALLRSAPSDERRLGVASLAESRLARAMRRRGRLEDALHSAQRAVSLDRLSLEQAPGSQAHTLRLSASLRLLARIEEARRDYAKAIATLRESNQVLETLRARTSETAAIDRGVMVGRSLLGSLLGEAGATAEALGLLREAYEAAGRRAASDPVDARAMRDLQAIALRYAGALLDARRRADGEPALRRAIEISRQLLKGDPGDRESRLNYGIALVTKAEYLAGAGDAAGALSAREEALGLHEDLLRAAPGDPDLLLPFLLNATELARRGESGVCERAMAGRPRGAFEATPELAAAEAALRAACSR